jgi:DNA-binding transcriptional LysR family regulator
MTYPIAGLAICLVPEQIVAMRHPEVVYVNISDDLPSLTTRVIAVHRAYADPAVIRVRDLARSTWPGRQ